MMLSCLYQTVLRACLQQCDGAGISAPVNPGGCFLSRERSISPFGGWGVAVLNSGILVSFLFMSKGKRQWNQLQ